MTGTKNGHMGDPMMEWVVLLAQCARGLDPLSRYHQGSMRLRLDRATQDRSPWDMVKVTTALRGEAPDSWDRPYTRDSAVYHLADAWLEHGASNLTPPPTLPRSEAVMPYSYAKERHRVLTPRGLDVLTAVRDEALRLIMDAGAVRADRSYAPALRRQGGDSWLCLAALDYLVETGVLIEVSGPATWGQYRTFVPGELGGTVEVGSSRS